MIKKILFWTIGLISVILIALTTLIVIHLVTYEVYGPVPVVESKNFNVNNIILEHLPIDSNDLNDYLAITVEIENKSKKKLRNFQITFNLDNGLQKYVPIITTESPKLTLSKKSTDKNNMSNIVIHTSDLLILKPNLISEDGKTEILDLINTMTLELSWHNGKEILLVSENDISQKFNFSQLNIQTNH